VEADEALRGQMQALYAELADRIAPHCHDVGRGILYEADRETVCKGATSFLLGTFENVWLVDRLATEGDWARIAPEATGAIRIVFYSIKGGVGRSTALAATAWALAQAGKRVLVLDLDLESPGLSSSLLSNERKPKFGITDWLLEDLLDNGDIVFQDMVATSDLSREGEIYVVPAHGEKPGEYIAKLGRAWMSKVQGDGVLEPWADRLSRLIKQLESSLSPDVILIDSRAGIDDVAASCVTGLGSNLVLLFALAGSQTWTGYNILFEHWLESHNAQRIRNRLQIVASLVPETDRAVYLKDLREDSYAVFANSLYDEIEPPADNAVGPDPTDEKKWLVREYVEGWNFDEADETAPHSPWPVLWHRSFAAIRSLHGRMEMIDAGEIELIFGKLIAGVSEILEMEEGRG
jgi:hypothetical protein